MKSKIQKTRILGFLGIGILFVAVWMLVLSPRFAKPGLLNQQKVAAEAKQAMLEKQVVALIASKNKIPEAQREIAILAKQFPPAAQLPELQGEITAAAAKAGISANNIVSINVDKPAVDQSGDNATLNISMSFVGNYGQVTSLINELYGMTRALSITQISVADNSNAATSSGKVTPGSTYLLTVSAKTYLFQPVQAIPPTLLH